MHEPARVSKDDTRISLQPENQKASRNIGSLFRALDFELETFILC